MSGVDLDTFDFAAALANAGRRSGQSLEGRRAAEKRKLNAEERRLVMTTNRTKQLNMKVRPETHAEFVARAESEGILPTQLFEKAWEMYKATVGIR